MMYNLLPQNVVINIPNGAGGVQAFNSAPTGLNWKYRLAYGAPLDLQGPSGAGRNVQANGAVEIINLISCALVAYIYAPGGVVQHVAVFHAHTGHIPVGEDPTAAHFNVPNVAAANIHVVFASSQPDMPAAPHSGIQTAADGLFTILNAGVPLANIRVLTSTPAHFGANFQGDVGVGAPVRYWGTANLANVLAQTVATATANYNAQFPPGVNSIGPFGSTHDRTEAAGRLQQLNLALNNAQTDNARIQAMTNFFNGPHSYKAGSLKLMMTQALDAEVRNVVPALPAVAGGITTMNAQQCWTQLFQQIQAGQI
jgi:hypothetical protein